jgi:hypothetical protein
MTAPDFNPREFGARRRVRPPDNPSGVVQVVAQLATGVDHPVSDYASYAPTVGEVSLLWLPASNQDFSESKRARVERKSQLLSAPTWKPIR